MSNVYVRSWPKVPMYPETLLFDQRPDDLNLTAAAGENLVTAHGDARRALIRFS
jgi:hypothetical protein